MTAGVSTACLYPMETTDALKSLLQNGVKCVEIFFNTLSEIQKPYTTELLNVLNEYGAKVKSIHPFTSGYEPYLIFSDYEKRFRETLEFYKSYFSCAAYLGAEIVVLHGDRKTSTNGISDELYFERFAQLARVAREYGVTLAQENVNAFRSQNPAFIRKMREYLGDEASFVFDIKQAVRSGNDPYEMCSAMGNMLVHVHINDNDNNNDCLLPGDGTMEYKRIFDVLKTNGYSGDFIVEVYRSNFSELSELIASYNLVDQLLEQSYC
ncbi:MULTISPECIES: sugar phosphate isomerase/epimerase [unclassified Ruminococcus]|uniref:sugar phosphate isomerase/epimerase family protein n=1 Tax=unclassified Ruminococcus TaxID=2608920 RepID=UPI00210C2D81|nr:MULTISPECIES: sugar phosphate isomerase/epimerase [unclassified Ruminococcus]MCQ4022618.1 TIM barrel protein [Ruminococcus sp. zg-924]MCQ4114858.1 TIM barrel protein [Ruminococcus sp. zg-921]